MNTIQLFYYSMFIAVPLVLGLTLPVSAMLAGRYARYFVYPYLAVLIFFTSSTYGVLDEDISGTIYGRGSGRTFFGFVNLYLYWLGLVVLFDSLWNKRQAPKAGIRIFLFLFTLVFLAHIPVGLYLEEPFFLIIHRSGVLNIFNMTVFVYVMLRVFRDQKSVNELVWLFMAAVLARCLWGLFRFVFLDGDPANFYANVQKLSVKLTFFDITDSVLASIAAFLAAWRLVDRSKDDSSYRRLFYWVVAIAGVLVILLSFRRTAWMGLIFAGLFFLYWHRQRISFVKLTPLLVLTAVAMGFFWFQRFELSASDDLLASLFPDIASGGRVSLQSGRFVELMLALDAIFRSPILGAGTWAEYATSSSRAEVAFHGGRFFFMHSGFLHVWLKTGLIGLALFSGALLASSYAAIKAQSELSSSEMRALAGAGIIGLVMFLPTLLFGTPIIEYRTMQVMGLALVLPYLARCMLANNKAAR